MEYEDLNSVNSAVAGCDYILNLAAMISVQPHLKILKVC